MRAFSLDKNRGGTGGAKKRVLILASSNLALQLLGFVYRMMLSRLAGSEALGLQSLVMQIYSITVSLCISGLNVAVMTAAARLDGSSTKVRTLTRSALLLFALLFACAALPIFAFRTGIAEALIGDREAKTAIVLVLTCIFLTGIENVLKSVHLGSGLVKRPAVSELIEQSIRYLLVFLLLKTVSNGTDHGVAALIMLGMLGSEVFSVSFLAVSFRKSFPIKARTRCECAGVGDLRETLGELVKILVPAALTSVAGTVFASASSLMLPSRLMLAGYTRAQALSAIGVLGTVAVPLVFLPMAFAGAVSTVALPSISSAYSRGDSASVRKIAKKSIFAGALAFLVFDLPLLPFFGRLAHLLFGSVPTGLCFLLLSLKAGVIYMQVSVSAVLNGMMKQKSVLYLAIFGEVSQLLLIHSLAALPQLHIYGYLISMAAGEGARLLLSLTVLHRFLKNDSRYKLLPPKKRDKTPQRSLIQ